jgi:hypothetical protein
VEAIHFLMDKGKEVRFWLLYQHQNSEMMRYIITITLIELGELMEWQIICLSKTSILMHLLSSTLIILEVKVFRCLSIQLQIKTHLIVLKDRIREGQETSLKQALLLSLALK